MRLSALLSNISRQPKYIKACTEGKFLAQTGGNSATNCTNCPKGRYSTATGLDDLSKCTLCPAGKSNKDEGSSFFSNCADCSAGEFASNPGAASCELCEKGSHSGSAATYCIPCIIGRYSDEKGTVSGSTTSCKACPKGKIGSRGQAVSIFDGCENCLVGTYQAETGKMRCTSCPQGRFGNETTGDSNRTSLSVSCTACAPGKYSEGTGLLSE